MDKPFAGQVALVTGGSSGHRPCRGAGLSPSARRSRRCRQPAQRGINGDGEADRGRRRRGLLCQN